MLIVILLVVIVVLMLSGFRLTRRGRRG